MSAITSYSPLFAASARPIGRMAQRTLAVIRTWCSRMRQRSELLLLNAVELRELSSLIFPNTGSNSGSLTWLEGLTRSISASRTFLRDGEKAFRENQHGPLRASGGSLGGRDGFSSSLESPPHQPHLLLTSL